MLENLYFLKSLGSFVSLKKIWRCDKKNQRKKEKFLLQFVLIKSGISTNFVKNILFGSKGAFDSRLTNSFWCNVYLTEGKNKFE
jgi:hypothetical protein